MSDRSPSIQEWKNLYEAAIKFKKTECWNWIRESDIFGVQNPASGEIGYCCIMGKLGEHFALAVYLGTEGLKGYLKTRSAEVPLDSIDMLHLQKCLMASFEDRRFLKKRDLQLIKKIGLKFRGRNSWPLFRNYLPGYYPWYLTGSEAKYLTLALSQAIEVSLCFKNDPDMLTPPVENHYLVRVPRKEKDGLRWRNEWLKPQPLEEVEIAAESVDENRLERIKRMGYRRQGTWEIDFFYAPMNVREEERPYYPYVILWIDHNSGFILHFHLARPKEYKSEFVEQFLGLIETDRLSPEEILIKKKEVFNLLEAITSRLGIKLRRVKRLPALEEAQAEMYKVFTRQNS